MDGVNMLRQNRKNSLDKIIVSLEQVNITIKQIKNENETKAKLSVENIRMLQAKVEDIKPIVIEKQNKTKELLLNLKK